MISIMNMNYKKGIFLALQILFSSLFFQTQAQVQLKLKLFPDEYGSKISDAQYGIFFEEINHAADGGLWSEMISNRSFEDNDTYPERWWYEENTTLSIANDNPMNTAQQQYLHVKPSADGAIFGNNGYWGMRLDEQSSYTLTFFVRADKAFSTTLTASLLQYYQHNTLIEASKDISIGTSWKKITMTLPDNNSLVNIAYLQLQTTSSNEFDIDVVSLMPAETYKGHGCRKDLA